MALGDFEWSAHAVGWPETQWAAVLIPCIGGPALQAMDTLAAEKMVGLWKGERGHPT